jgi:hypothetical protein
MKVFIVVCCGALALLVMVQQQTEPVRFFSAFEITHGLPSFIN